MSSVITFQRRPADRLIPSRTYLIGQCFNDSCQHRRPYDRPLIIKDKKGYHIPRSYYPIQDLEIIFNDGLMIAIKWETQIANSSNHRFFRPLKLMARVPSSRWVSLCSSHCISITNYKGGWSFYWNLSPLNGLVPGVAIIKMNCAIPKPNVVDCYFIM